MKMASAKQAWTHMVNRRSQPRKSVVWSGELIRSCGEVLEVIVLDISAGGAKLRVQRPFSTGEAVAFASARSEKKRRAQVVWVSSDRIGIKFDDWNDLVEGERVGAPGTDTRSRF